MPEAITMDRRHGGYDNILDFSEYYAETTGRSAVAALAVVIRNSSEYRNWKRKKKRPPVKGRKARRPVGQSPAC